MKCRLARLQTKKKHPITQLIHEDCEGLTLIPAERVLYLSNSKNIEFMPNNHKKRTDLGQPNKQISILFR